MKIKESIRQKVAVLSIKGNLMGPPGTDKLIQNIELLLHDGIKRIILDMKHVGWINSMGVGSIMKCYKLIEAQDGRFCLVALTEKVKGVFQVTRLIQILSIKADLDQAVNELNKT